MKPNSSSVGNGGVVDDRSTPYSYCHPRWPNLFYEQAVEGDLARVIGQVKDAVSLGNSVSKSFLISNERTCQGVIDGFAQITFRHVIVHSHVDHISRNGQAQRHVQRVRRSLNLDFQLREESQCQRSR